MDINEIFKDDEHDKCSLEPHLQKDVDTLSAMLEALLESTEEAIRHTKIMPLCDHGQSTTQNIAPGFTVVSIENGRFRGLKICLGCCRKASMLYRDAARVMDEICEAVEKHPEKKAL